MNLPASLERLYRLLDTAARSGLGANSVAEAMRLRRLAERGVYVFLDPAEDRGGGGARIVRVGTHALRAGSSSTLRQRLSQHRGKVASGGGNHRGSIFRLLVGQALIASGRQPVCPTWGVKGAPGEAAAAFGLSRADIAQVEGPIEQAVSRYVAGLRVVCIPVNDAPGPESARGLIERGAIAMLSQAMREGLVPVGASWLGRKSNRPAVVASGLWNQNHVGDDWSPEYIAELERRTAG
jgi:hypothetical protein